MEQSQLDTKYSYSATNNAFYPKDLYSAYEKSGNLPRDLVDVETIVFTEFTQTPPPGKYRIAGGDGMPAWEDIPTPTHEQLIAAAETEKQSRIDKANDYINSKQWPGKAAIGRLKGNELAQYNLRLDYLDALEAVDTSGAPDIEWPKQPVSQAK